MRREISEAKPMEAKTHIGLDDVVKRSFECLQKGVTEKAEEKLDAATEKSFAELEKELEYKNNDDGMPYRMEQDLLSDAEYKRNGYEYTTDHLGRLFTAEGDLHLKEHDGRLQIKDSIHDIGKGYEKSTDDRGHAIADRFDGANDLENLIPQDSGLNRNEFKNNDDGMPYRMEQDLLSDAEYKRNGYEYTTDHLGRLFTAEGDLHLKEHDGRLQIKDSIHDIGKGYEKSTDDRGHAIADRFDGANDLENLIPQDSGLNRNEFKNFENKLAQEVEAGKKVNLKLEMHYPGDSFRPDAITAVTTIDGKQEVKVFLNDKY